MPTESKISTLVVIPARLHSSRLPNKVLAKIHGVPMVALTYFRVRSAIHSDVVVAVDSSEVEHTLGALNVPTIMTSDKCKNGTERVFEVATKLSPYERYVNVQADEPLLNPLCLEALIADETFRSGFTCAISSCSSGGDTTEVKVAVSSNSRIRYCSRSAIPHTRGSGPGEQSYYKIHGIYSYTRAVLEQYIAAPAGVLEEQEQVEQLRCIENDIPLYALKVPRSERSVDTLDDLKFIAGQPKSLFTMTEKGQQ